MVKLMLFRPKISLYLMSIVALGMASAENGPHTMLEQYSQRAKQVVFIARFKAGKDGAHAIGLDHLLEGIIVEDQGREAMFKFLGDDPTTTQLPGYDMKSSPPPFLSPDVASLLLARLNQLSPHAKSVPESQDMPLSVDVVRMSQAALKLADKFHTDKVEPLHLLAAALQEHSSKAVRIFFEYGITEDRVVAELTEKH
jgi:ATP-dependent Clp protease ATP-binding subunit ClpC